jgi:hypothetical protein
MVKQLVALVVAGLFVLSPEVQARRAARPMAARPMASSETPADSRKQARALVVKGAGEIARGDYVKALALFTQAYAIYPSPKILFNMAQTYRELGRLVEALNAYERFLHTAKPGTSRDLLKVARSKVQGLKGEVATLLIQVSVPGALIRIDGAEVGLSPMDIPRRVMPGRHLVVVSKKGYLTATERVTPRKSQRLVFTITLVKPRPKVVVRNLVFRIRKLPRRGLAVLWTGIGLTAAAAVGIAIAGALTKYEERILNDTSQSVSRRKLAVTRGKRYQWLTEGFIIGAGVAAIFTTIWGLTVVRASGGVERVPVNPPTVTIMPVGTGILVRSAF